MLVVYGERALSASLDPAAGLQRFAKAMLPEGCQDDAAFAPSFAALAHRAVVIWPEAGAGGVERAHRHAAMIAGCGVAAVGVANPAPVLTRPLLPDMPKFALSACAEVALRRAKAVAWPSHAGQGPRALAPWPERVDPLTLFGEVCSLLSSQLAEPPAAVETMALWCLHAWCMRGQTALFDMSPRLVLQGVDARADHARTLRLVAWLTPSPLILSRAIASQVLPIIAAERPTLLIDDITGGTLYRRDMRTLMTAGAYRDGMFLTARTRRNECSRSSCFAPAAVATTSVLPEDLRLRSVVVRMAPAPAGQARPSIGLIDPSPHVFTLRARMQAAALALGEKMRDAAGAANTNESWHPLLTLARNIGEGVGRRAAEAAALFTAAAPPPASNLALLRDIRDLCTVDERVRIGSSDMLAKLTADPERPWATAFRGKPLNSRTLAERLASFGIRPGVVRKPDGAVARGYRGEALIDAFSRYLTDVIPAEENADALQATPM
ncbi:MAG: DUF3631 domain-containing protein [Alphaproteobacteria bacterium]|nr:DUF3631 domain-containing protein [Alphaproteobacteria bacterium]